MHRIQMHGIALSAHRIRQGSDRRMDRTMAHLETSTWQIRKAANPRRRAPGSRPCRGTCRNAALFE